MREITTIEEIVEIMDNDSREFGFRNANDHDVELLERGYLDCSFDWSDGEMSEEKLNGTCAVGISIYLSEDEIMKRYNQTVKGYGKNNLILLVADNHCEYGNDENEVILGHDGYGADIVAIVKL